MKSNKYKKYLWLSLLVLVVLIPSATVFAQAAPAAGAPAVAAPPANSDAGGCGILPASFCHPVAWLANSIGSWFIYIGSFFGMILAWAVGWILAFGQNIVNSPPVQAGFGVTLAIANMGFVLMIIIIAISTILRLERYGIKALLAKVIIAAVLINFGLVLSGIVLNFSDSVTNYFLQGVTGTNSATDPSVAFFAFRDRMVASFQPQKLVNPNVASSSVADAAKSLTGLAGGGDGPSMNLFVSMLMSIIGVVLVLITLATFVIMLTIRYVTLVLLLVLLPLAWMAAVFPGLNKHFSKWMGTFIEQLIFPPVALFFLWLAMTISGKTILLSGNDKLITALNNASPIAAGIIGPLFNVVTLSALMLGGLVVAKSLGGAGADVGLGWAKSTGNWAKGKAGRGGANIGARALRAGGAQKLSQNLQKVGSGRFGALARMTGVSFLAEKAGRGLDAGMRGGELNYKYYADRAGKLDANQIKNRIPQSRGAELAALLAEAPKKKVSVSELMDKIPKGEQLSPEDWARYGNAKGFKDVENAAGSSAVRSAQEELRTAEASGDAKKIEEASAKFEAATTEFVKGMDKEAAGKFEWKYMMGLKNRADIKASGLLIRKLAELHPDYIGSISSKMSAEDKDKMSSEAHGYYTDAIAAAEAEKKSIDITVLANDPEALNKIDQKITGLTKQKDKIENSMSDVAMLVDKLTAASSTAPAPAPAAPKP